MLKIEKLYVFMYMILPHFIMPHDITSSALFIININITAYKYIHIYNRASCAQVHQLPQNHCGDNPERTPHSE